MAQSEGYSERTYPPTRHRLQEARKRGQVARSAELTGAAVLLAGATVLAMLSGELLKALTRMTASLLSARAGDAAITHGLWEAAAPVIGLVGILVAAVLVVAVLAGAMQVGLVVSGEPLRLDFARLSPARGLGRVFSLRSLVRCAGAIAKVLAVALVAGLTLRAEFSSMLSAGTLDAAGFAAGVARTAYRLTIRVGAVLLVLAVGDYLYQRWQHRQDLQMSRREVREEARRVGRERIARRERKAGRPGRSAKASTP